MLSAGLEASDGTRQIAQVAGLQTAAAGFIKEYHPKLAPVDTQRAGMFVCGTAQGPKNIPDSIAQAKAAAARAIAMLSQRLRAHAGPGGRVGHELCASAAACARRSARRARWRSRAAPSPTPWSTPNICRGCGICAADCPSGAMQLGGFSDAEILAEVTV